MSKFYSIGLESEFQVEDTLKDAKKEAESWLEQAHDTACDEGEWPETTEEIQYGILIPLATATETDENGGPCKANDEYCNYELLPVAPDANAILALRITELESQLQTQTENMRALEKERDELRERVMEYDAEQLARVCPGCHAVAPERCSPGCIDAEMEREREDERMNGDPREEEDGDEGDMPW